MPGAYEAERAWVAYEAVPKNEPVKDPVKEEAVTLVVTFKEFRAASDPDIMTYFQLGIFSLYYGWLQVVPVHFPFGPIICL